MMEEEKTVSQKKSGRDASSSSNEKDITKDDGHLNSDDNHALSQSHPSEEKSPKPKASDSNVRKRKPAQPRKIDSSTEFEDTSEEEEALQSTSSNSQAVESEKLHQESKTGEQEKRQLDKQSSEKKTSTDVDFSDQDSEGLPDVDDKVPKEGVSISKEAKSNENQKVLKGSKKSVSTAESSSNSKNDAVSYKEGKNNKEVQLSSDSNIKKGRGRPRKLTILPLKNSGDTEGLKSTSLKMKIIKPKENISEKPISADKNISDRESSVEAPESKDGSEATNAAPAVYAVKSKPIRQKRKYDEPGKNVKKSAPPVKIPKSSTHDTMASPVKIVSKASTQVEKRVLRQTRAAPSEKSKKSTRTSSRVKAVSSASAKNTSSPNKNSTEGNHKKDSALLQKDTLSSDTNTESEPEESTSVVLQKKKREYSCCKCNEKFPKTDDLFSHICQGKTEVGYICEICENIYVLRSTYINHKIIHSIKKPYKCKQCDKKSASQSNHLYHMKKFHPDSKPFNCEYSNCNRSFLTRKKQKAHQKRHNMHKCIYCDLTFPKDNALKKHRFNEHERFFN